MKPVPHIESVGLPPELHADRVVGEMLQHIARTYAGAWVRYLEEIRPAGSPKAQRRMIKAIERAGGDSLIKVWHEPGTRGRYQLAIFDWTAWDETRRAEIMPGAMIPGRPWLCCSVTQLGGRGEKLKSKRILYITHHALSRLAQRCGARTVADLISATRRLGMAFLTKCVEARRDGTERPDGRLLVEGLCTAVLKRCEDRATIVVTVVEP